MGKNSKNNYSQKLESLKRQRTQEEEEKAQKQRQFEKKLREKSRYSKQLTRRNQKGQMVMSAMVSHLLGKITKNQH